MWQFCIDHSLVSAVLALFVWSIARSLRKPAIAHALWLIVLLKLMTPPLVAVPVWNDWPAGNQQRPATGQNAKTGTLSTTEPSPSTRIPEITEATIELPTRFLVEPDFAWQAALLTVWLSGSIVWLFCRLRHAVRFAERMNDAQPAASALRDRADRLARLIGLKQAPRVVVVPAVISPMLWGLGNKTRLLFPASLLARLDADSCDTLLVHELAHYRRGDHYVRLLEFVASGLLWWHPLVWWIRRELETYEEKACDAWVVTRLPGSRRRYADALLATLDFLSRAPVTLPPIATGIGDVPLLRERLAEIMNGPPEPQIPTGHRAGLIVAAMATLFFSPALPTRVFDADEPSRFELASSAGDSSNVPSVLADTPLASRPSARGATTGAFEARSPTAWDSLLTAADEERVLAPKGSSSLVRQRDGALRWRLTTGRELDVPGPVSAIAFSPEGELLVTCDADRVVRCRDASSGDVIHEFRGHKDLVQTIAFFPGGQMLVTGSRDGEVVLWSLYRKRPLGRLISQDLPVNALAVSASGDLLAVALGADAERGVDAHGGAEAEGAGKLLVVDLFTGCNRFEKMTPLGLAAIVFRDDGGFLAAGDWSGVWTAWDIEGWRPIGSPQTMPRQFGDRIRFSSEPGDLAQIGWMEGLKAELKVSPEFPLNHVPQTPLVPGRAG